jgi:beta-glucanase (GH16 family)
MVGYPWGPYNTGAIDNAYYQRSQISVTSQGLALSAQPASSPWPTYQGIGPFPWLSGGFNTNASGGYTTKYGYFESSMKFAGGKGMWPAFWLYNTTQDGGEFDIMEHVNSEMTIEQNNAIAGPVHIGGNIVTLSSDPTQNFHTYGILWTPTGQTSYVDGVPGLHTTVSNSELMWIIFDNAVGGPGSWPGQPDGMTTWPQVTYVKYLRVYTPTGADC